MSLNRTLLQLFVLGLIFTAACTDDEALVKRDTSLDSVKVSAAATTPRACSSCKYIVPIEAMTVDGAKLGIKPGDVICLNSAIKYFHSLHFTNIVGTATAPVIIANCGGTAVLTANGRPFNIKTSKSKYFRITGGDVAGTYGIKMSGPTGSGVVLAGLSTNFEVDHVEVFNTGFAGIIAKSDPTCDNTANRGYFTMRGVSIHDNYTHHTNGEGLYIGHSFYSGYQMDCGVKLPHTIEGLRVYNNKALYTGWDGIQVGCATKDSEIYNNTITYPGTKLISGQGHGINIASGTVGRCYGNYIKGGAGNGITVWGLGDNTVYNNVIISSAMNGIFCDERTETLGSGYRLMNNTIINPKLAGIRLLSEKVPNVVINNIVVNPGYAPNGERAYLMRPKLITIVASNNYNTTSISSVKFVDVAAGNYRLSTGSPAIEKGKSISTYGIPLDFYKSTRLKGTYYDIGASEY
jgi:hypothetical protein